MDKNENIFHLVNSNNPITFSALIGTLRSTHPSIRTTSKLAIAVEFLTHFGL